MQAFWTKRVDKERASHEKALHDAEKKLLTGSKNASRTSSKNTSTGTTTGGGAPKEKVNIYTDIATTDRPGRAWLPGGLNKSTPPAQDAPKGKKFLSKGTAENNLPPEWAQHRKNSKSAAGAPQPPVLSNHGANRPTKFSTRGGNGAPGSSFAAGSAQHQQQAASLNQDQLLRSIANIEQHGPESEIHVGGAGIAKSVGKSGKTKSSYHSSRWRGSVNPGSERSSVAGSAGEAQFQEEIRSVVEQEVTKLLAPLEKELQEEREKRQRAEELLKKHYPKIDGAAQSEASSRRR
eukprot:g11623.t1